MHKKIIILSYCFFVLFSISCTSSIKRGQLRKGYSISKAAIKEYNSDEIYAINCIDSLGLIQVYDSCIKRLYFFYGPERLDFDGAIEGTTIGECNIRLIAFDRKKGDLAEMTFGVFINDSIPTKAILKTSLGDMINVFCIDIQQKKIIYAQTAETGRVSYNNIAQMYDSARNSVSLNNYICRNSSRIHRKFKSYL